ncbi:glycosyltransferase [Myxococcota bacterium]|nr:glycosyltransferase [Myxococcota bacterium]
MKTRMTPPLSPEQAAGLYAAMLGDVLDASLEFARRLELEPFLHFDPPDAREAIASLAPPGYRREPQRGLGLAERMANAFSEAAESGCGCLLLRGSDSPALDFEIVEEALTRLEAGADLVLTPDQGGGYALIGMKEPHLGLFEIRLSTDSVLAETLARARSLGLVAATTRASFDLDVGADLARLDALPPLRSSVLCPHTVEFLGRLHRIGVL